MIELLDVRRTFNQGKPNEFTALHGISLRIEERLMTVLQGPSGSGKTTLLSLIGCMSRPTSGRIYLRDREMTSLPERFLTEVRRMTFGFIFQNLNLMKGLTALENVMLPAFPTGEKMSKLRERSLDLLGLFGVREKAGVDVACVSGGEARRVTIARALINDPDILIADEPTAHLDSRLSLEFMDLMAKLRQDGKTVIIASHDPLVFDFPFVDRVVRLRDGRIEGEGP